MDIAITGSKGFIGTTFKSLINDNHKIIELDIADGIDISDKTGIESIEKFDLIIHLAAKSYVPDSYKNSLDFYYTNINSTLNVLELSKKFNARILYISSYVYGSPDYLPIDENHTIKPFNPYSQSKIISETLVKAYNRDFGVNGVILRPFNIYGYGQSEAFLIPTIIKQLEKGEINLNDPRPRRDFLHVSDFCKLLVKLIDYENSGVEVFNVGYGMSHSISEIISILEKISNKKDIKTTFSQNYRKEEVLDVVADITKVRNAIGWNPEFTLEAGLTAYLRQTNY